MTTDEFTWNDIRPGDIIVLGYSNPGDLPTDAELVISVVFNNDLKCTVVRLELWGEHFRWGVYEDVRLRHRSILTDNRDCIIRDGIEIYRPTNAPWK